MHGWMKCNRLMCGVKHAQFLLSAVPTADAGYFVSQAAGFAKVCQGLGSEMPDNE